MLTRARDLLAERPGAWIQGKLAADSDGILKSPWSNLACRWSLTGALDLTSGMTSDSDQHGWQRHLAREALIEAILLNAGIETGTGYRVCLTVWNDTDGRTRNDVLAALDRAIEELDG
ncbi:DUF6197 family protein [Candidatus Poriferisocius sp.]|uniref:DUF6197 family protein n=1 Tax=Candidatus Poriferisocius sp. TaxID=3101276 RepID=UPI003B026854